MWLATGGATMPIHMCPQMYSPLIHFRRAQNVHHVLKEEEKVTRSVAAFLNPSFT